MNKKTNYELVKFDEDGLVDIESWINSNEV